MASDLPLMARRIVEYSLFTLVTGLCRVLPVDVTSNVLAALARTIGPRIAASRRIRVNLDHVWPHLSKEEQERIVRGTCDNFARIANDYWQMDRIREQQDRRIEIVGGEYLEAIQSGDRGSIIFTAHLGGWQVIPFVTSRYGLPMTVFRRKIDNLLVNRAYEKSLIANGVSIAMKEMHGLRHLAAILRRGDHVGMLVDVRFDGGLSVPFLGRDAMTATGPAVLARRYDALLVPVRTERLGPAKFRVTVEEPRPAVRTDDQEADIRATLCWMNERIGEWVRARPEQWFWFHRRWGKNLNLS